MQRREDSVGLVLVVIAVVMAALLGRTVRQQQARADLQALEARMEQLSATWDAGAAERWEREERALEELEDLTARSRARCTAAWGEEECARRFEQLEQEGGER